MCVCVCGERERVGCGSSNRIPPVSVSPPIFIPGLSVVLLFSVQQTRLYCALREVPFTDPEPAWLRDLRYVTRGNVIFGGFASLGYVTRGVSIGSGFSLTHAQHALAGAVSPLMVSSGLLRHARDGAQREGAGGLLLGKLVLDLGEFAVELVVIVVDIGLEG